MAVNKVNYGDEILIDLTEDTVTTDSLLNGVTAHSSNGERIVGNVTVPTKVSELTNDSGYLTAVPSEYVTESELSAKGYVTTSQIPTKLPANGGNADTVDGYHIRTASSGDTGKAGYITFIV